MKEYKYIAIPNSVVAKGKDVQGAINNYFDVINQESVDGWEFVTVAPINLMIKKGAFKTENENQNVFIFSRLIEE